MKISHRSPFSPFIVSLLVKIVRADLFLRTLLLPRRKKVLVLSRLVSKGSGGK